MHIRQIQLLILFICTSLFGMSPAMGQFVLDDFSVRSEGADILISWEVSQESGISEFRLYRDIDSQNNYAYVGTVFANGTSVYQYLDTNVYKDGPKLVTYELQVVKDGKVHKFYTTLSHNPTSIQRTWGSIKSMFR